MENRKQIIENSFCGNCDWLKKTNLPNPIPNSIQQRMTVE
jgi:hypothetical protein